jgi:hypothetical protein
MTAASLAGLTGIVNEECSGSKEGADSGICSLEQTEKIRTTLNTQH